MEGLKDIVEQINFSLKNSFIKNGFGALSLFGISETTTREETSFPVFFKTNQGTWAGFDDKKEVIVYHKLNSAQTSQAPNGYGDKGGETINRYAMNLVVYFKSNKVKPDEMFAFIQAVLPETLFLKDSNFTFIRTGVGSSILNTQQVFSGEYKGIKFTLKAEQSLINISYTIESRFKKGCFVCCDTPLQRVLPDRRIAASVSTEVECCVEPTLISFSDVDTIDIPLTATLLDKYGEVPTVEVWILKGTTYVKPTIEIGFDDYPPTRILADLGGLATGFIKIS